MSAAADPTAPTVPETTSVPRTAPRARRWLALDLFRFAAVCLMVQGHVFSTLLDRATKAQGWYPHHSFVHGYTAPMFMFGAGLAFGYTTFRKWDEHVKVGPAARKRFTRYGWLLFIGYLLHLPTLSIAQLVEIDDPERLQRMLQVDVLQHIGMSLAICQALVAIVKNRRVFIAIVTTLAVVLVLAAPWAWAWDLSGGPLPVSIAGYVNASTGSIFPLTPWAGFTYAGIVVAYAVGLAKGGGVVDVSAKAAWPFTLLAAAFMLIPIGIDRLGPLPWPSHNFWKTNPLFFFWRLGNVMAVLAVLCHVERVGVWLGLLGDAPTTVAQRLVARVVPWVKLIAAESLIVYVAHLVVLHGSVIAPGIKHWEVTGAHSHGVLGASIVTLLLFLAMVALAKAWNELKKQPKAFRAVQIAMLALLAYLMISS